MKIKTLLFLFLPVFFYCQGLKVSGIITDSVSKNPLGFASILISGTNRGTSSNLDGEFSLKVYRGDHTLIFSYIGYKTDSVNIEVSNNMALDISLIPQAIVLPEIVVNEEDPAYRIIREAIKRKEKNRQGLRNFEYDAYSKKIVKSVGEVAVIEESFVKGYNKIGEWEKEFIKSIHKTENVKKEMGSMDINITNSYYVDFSRDTLTLFMNKVFLPLSDNAFDYYNYKLLKTNVSNEREIYEIEVIPKSSIQPLLKGTITIDNIDYALNSVELSTNEGIRFPYVNNLEANFTQRLSKQSDYWLPLYIEYNASLDINLQGLIKIGTMEFNQLSNLTNYKINSIIPDSIINAKRSKYGGYTVDTSKTPPKPLELARTEIDSIREIPLTKKEIGAYETLDSSMTMRKLVKIEGALADLIPEEDEQDTTTSIWGAAFEYLGNYLEFRNNRVAGILLGLKYNDEIIDDKLSISSTLGYSLKRKQYEGKIDVEYYLSDFWISGINFGYNNFSAPWQELYPYPDLLNSLGVSLGLEDHFNYYLLKGITFGIMKRYKDHYNAKLSFSSESQKSLNDHRYQSIFSSNREVRENPEIIEGKDNSIRLSVAIGKNPLDPQVIPENGLVALASFSSNSIDSDFEYQKFRLITMLQTKTFYDELFISPYLHMIVDAGIVIGDYGPQHIFTPNSAYSFYSPFGVLKGIKPYQYVGTEMIAVHLEHNWRTVPFQSIGLDFLSDLHLDIITGISGLKVWNQSDYLTEFNMNGSNYWEAYLSISRIFAFARIDFAYTSLEQFHTRCSIGMIF